MELAHVAVHEVATDLDVRSGCESKNPSLNDTYSTRQTSRESGLIMSTAKVQECPIRRSKTRGSITVLGTFANERTAALSLPRDHDSRPRPSRQFQDGREKLPLPAQQNWGA